MAMHKTVAVVGLPGGLPIFSGGTVIGGIAVSGAAAAKEEKCGKDGNATILAGRCAAKLWSSSFADLRSVN